MPKEIRHHRSVRVWCRRFGRKPDEAILDINYMREAMGELPDAKRRGRPDIVQYFLLNVLESPAGMDGLVEVYVHTYDGKMFYVEPETRIPRSYARFVGIMSQVLRGEDTPRIHPLDKNPHQIIKEKKELGFKIMGLDEQGELALPEEVLGRNSLVIIGGFQRGDYRGSYYAERWIKIGNEIYPSWVVGAEVVAGWERKFLFTW